MIDKDNLWWNRCCETAERITAIQMGVDYTLAHMADMRRVRLAVAKMLAPKAANSDPPHRSASLRTRLMLAATNKKRAELGQPLISFD